MSILTPWIANIFISKGLTFLPLAATVFFVCASKSFLKNLSMTKSDLVIFFLVVTHVLFSIATGRGIGSGGTLIIFFYSYIFFYAMKKSTLNIMASDILKLTMLVYLFHLLAIFIELCVSLLGYQYLFIDLGGAKLIVNSYKSYNHADFIRFLGFENVKGLASLLLGSQSASQLTVIGAFLFAPLYFTKKTQTTKSFLFALCLIPFTSTQTSLLIFLMLLLYSIYISQCSRIGTKKMMLLIALISLPLSVPLYNMIFYKLTNIRQLDQYLLSFMEPVFRFNSLPIADKIMGEGARGRAFLEKYGGAGSDFGLMTLINQTGMYLMGLSFFLLATITIKSNLVVRKFHNLYGYYSSWCALSAVNVTCMLGWYMSLIHYTTAVEAGGREIFALHIAISAVSIHKLTETIRIDNTSLGWQKHADQ
jgi:hypothetical protein